MTNSFRGGLEPMTSQIMRMLTKIQKYNNGAATSYTIAAMTVISVATSVFDQALASNINSYTADNTTITISWTEWNGYPHAAHSTTQYRVCWKIDNTWGDVCNQHKSLTITARSYTINGLTAGTSFKVRVKAETKWPALLGGATDWRTLDTVIVSTSGSTLLAVTNALSSEFDLQMTYIGFTNWNNIRVCYKKATLWTIPTINDVCRLGD